MTTPIPYVAMWSAEMAWQERHRPRPQRIVTPYGWLWEPTPTVPDGEPLFRNYHNDRHAECMGYPQTETAGFGLLFGRCQVCGKRLPPAEALWPLTAVEYDVGAANTPPICEPCLTVSRKACPHLATTDTRSVFVAPNGWEVAGVRGQDAKRGGPTALVRVDDPARTSTVGWQVCVRLNDPRPADA
jgi:hypothetical protein